MHQFRITKRCCVAFPVMLAVLGLGCTKNTPAPKIASSADSPGYAVAFPGALSESLTRYAEHEGTVKNNTDAFSSYPDALNEPDFQAVKTVYVQADRTGRGQAYADRIDDQRAVEQFFEEERDDLARRTNAAVVNALEKSNCNCEPETHGAISYGLKDGVEKRLEKRLLEVGGVERLLKDDEKRLGKKNVSVLSDQASRIAFTAYVVFVELPTLYQEVSRRLEEVDDVKKTIEAEITRENALISDAASSKADKKEADKRLTDLNGALTAIDIFESEATQLLKRSEKEIPALQKRYEDAFDNLLSAVDAKTPK